MSKITDRSTFAYAGNDPTSEIVLNASSWLGRGWQAVRSAQDSFTKTVLPAVKEIRVKDYVVRAAETGEQVVKVAGSAIESAKRVYDKAWFPYRMLKHPFSYKNLLVNDSAEKNLNTLTEITAGNVEWSVVTPDVARKVPKFSLSQDKISAISNLTMMGTFASPLIYYPTYTAAMCVRNGSGIAALDVSQIIHDTGMCLNQSAKVYQGPEAMLTLATSYILGSAVAITSQAVLHLLLKDFAKGERFEELERIYTDVAMLLKKRWDDAYQAKDRKEMDKCVELATKLALNLELISDRVQISAFLNPPQVASLKMKLKWAANYVLNYDKFVKSANAENAQ